MTLRTGRDTADPPDTTTNNHTAQEADWPSGARPAVRVEFVRYGAPTLIVLLYCGIFAPGQPIDRIEGDHNG